MKRNIMKQGLSSFALSLPRKWVIENNLNYGDNVELRIKDGKLVISPYVVNDKYIPSEKINGSEINGEELLDTLFMLYRLGYGEIKISDISSVKNDINFQENVHINSNLLEELESTSILEILDAIVENMYGVELKKSGNDIYIIRSETLEEKDFDRMLFEIFDHFSDIITSFENHGTTILSNELKYRIHFCYRILNEVGYESDKVTNILHSLVFNIERMAVDFDYFSKEFDDLSNETFELLDEQYERLKDYYFEKDDLFGDIIEADKVIRRSFKGKKQESWLIKIFDHFLTLATFRKKLSYLTSSL